MYTECPDCHTYFKITPEQLKAAEGKVRCGNCNHVFNALTHLAEKVPPVSPPEAESEEIVEVDDGPESVVAFQVDDPESEAALSEISLPITAESLSLTDSEAIGEKDELSLESMVGLSALVDDADEVASQVNINGKDLDSSSEPSEVISVKSELSGNSEVSSLKTELSGFSELLSTPVEMELEAPVASLNIEASGMQSRLSEMSDIGEKSTIDRPETDSPEAVSFADIDVPGVESGDLKTVSEAVSSVENVVEDDREDINKDIDNALDNLFDDDELALEKSTESEDPFANEGSISSINNLSGLDDLEIDDIELKASEKSQKFDISELDLSDDYADSPVAAKESAQKEVSEFDLDDEFLSSEPLKGEETEWEPLQRSATSKDNYAGENYKLEELEDNKSQVSGGASKVMWVLVIGVLFIVLLGQFAYLKREELAKYPSVRPILEQACAVLNTVVSCKVPEPRDVKAIVIVDRNVVSHPNAKNALLITSTVKNEANFTQQYPELILTFSDINQKTLARRTFKPEEYLAKGVDISSGMQSNIPLKIMLEIVDPGEAAVNFEFDFR